MKTLSTADVFRSDLEPGLYQVPVWMRLAVLPVQIVRLHGCDRAVNPLSWFDCVSMAWVAFRNGCPWMEVPARVESKPMRESKARAVGALVDQMLGLISWQCEPDNEQRIYLDALDAIAELLKR